MRRVIWPVLFLFLVVVQGSSSVFYTGWLSFNLPLLAVYSYALLEGELLGAAVGFGVGVLHIVTIGVCSAAIRFLYWWIEVIRSGGRWGLFLDFSWASIGYCLGNMLLVVPMFWAIKWIHTWTQKDDITY